MKYRELVEHANSIILRMDTQGKITFFNEFAERFFDYSQEEILGRHVVGAIVPETDAADRDLTAMIRDIFQNPDRYIRNENENMKRNGERVWIIWDNKPIFDEDGRLTEVLCVGSDVTERRRAEEAQRRSEERYHTLFERARDAIFITAEDGLFIDCNQGACNLLGYRREELLEMRQEDIAPPDFKDRAAQRRTQIIREEKWQKPFETRASRKDSVILDIEVSGTPIELHGRTHVIYFVRDITERKRSERELEKLRQQEKLAAIGKISSGLAHELNNPAAAAQRATQEISDVLAAARTHAMALGRLSLTQEQMDLLLAVHEQASTNQNPPGSSDPLAESAREEEIAGWLEGQGVPDAWRLGPALAHADLSVEQLQAVANGLPEESHSSAFAWLERSIVMDALVRETTVATRRISDLVNAVKSYSLMDQSSKGAMDVHQGLDDTLTLLGHKLREHKIEVVRAYDPGLRSVEANGPELNQVWTNLIDNAIDAAGPGGEIRLRTSQETDTVLVEIVDNGPGIPEEIRSKVFEPFFTTKDVGKGTGLGLQIVHRIVRETHHGEIEIDSKPGETRFRIRLPVSAGTPER